MSAGRFLDQKATFDVLPRLIDIWDSKYWSGGCINRNGPHHSYAVRPISIAAQCVLSLVYGWSAAAEEGHQCESSQRRSELARRPGRAPQ